MVVTEDMYFVRKEGDVYFHLRTGGACKVHGTCFTCGYLFSRGILYTLLPKYYTVHLPSGRL